MNDAVIPPGNPIVGATPTGRVTAMLDFGISPDVFRKHHFEQQPLLRQAAFDAAAIDWQDLDDALQIIEPDDTQTQLFLNGPVPLSQYVQERFEHGRHVRRINKQLFYGHMNNGATLALNRFEHCSNIARQLCHQVGLFTGHTTTSNTYITFTTPVRQPEHKPGNHAGAFGKHWDTHDVFAIQLIGQKRWRIFAPTLPLPLSNQTSRLSQHTPPTQPVLECVLSPGDLLYIPRGWWHEVSLLDSASWHVSVGSYTHTVSDYVMWLCSRYLPQILNARKTFDREASNHGDISPALLTDILQQITQAALNGTNRNEFMSVMESRSPLATEFHTGALLARQPLTATTLITLGTPHAIGISNGEVRIEGGVIRLNAVTQAIIHILNQHRCLSLADLHSALSRYPAAALHEAVLDLARFELINVITS